MAASWTAYCRHHEYSVNGSEVTVTVANRSHDVTVIETEDCYLFRAIVVRKKLVSSLTDLPRDIWLRNRDMSLVGFRIDRKTNLLAEAWLPKAGVTTGEFRLYLRAVAEESDRFEYQLSGQDQE